MRSSWRRAVQGVLDRHDPDARIVRLGTHARVELSNGARIGISTTPGDRRELLNFTARVKRELRKDR